jgi:protein SCO1/2
MTLRFPSPPRFASLAVRIYAVILLTVTPAFANHPGENLNQAMADKEAAFEPITAQEVPDVKWVAPDGATGSLEALTGKITVLSFAPDACGSPCEAQQEQLGKTLSALNASAMREMVAFVTLRDTASVAPAEPNWTSAQLSDAERLGDTVDAFAAASARTDEAPMVHLLNREGAQVGIFHGADFEPTNLVLYINGLTHQRPHAEPGFWQRVTGWFQ